MIHHVTTITLHKNLERINVVLLEKHQENSPVLIVNRFLIA